MNDLNISSVFESFPKLKSDEIQFQLKKILRLRLLQPNQHLKIENKIDDFSVTEHTVLEGETLSSLNRKYGVPVDSIKTYNPDKIYENDNIHKGDVLIIKKRKR